MAAAVSPSAGAAGTANSMPDPGTAAMPADGPDADALTLANSVCKAMPDAKQVSFNDGTAISCQVGIFYGLIWELSVHSASMTYDAAQSYCNGLSLSGRVWRLPTVEELNSIAFHMVHLPGYTQTWGILPGQPQEPFWSSTLDAAHAGAGFVLNFRGGSRVSSSLQSAWRVRCVTTAGYAR